jgi:hypothetical protein
LRFYRHIHLHAVDFPYAITPAPHRQTPLPRAHKKAGLAPRLLSSTALGYCRVILTPHQRPRPRWVITLFSYKTPCVYSPPAFVFAPSLGAAN